MEKMPIRQLTRQCCVLGLILVSMGAPTPAQAQDEPRVANRSPLQFGKNYWPSRSSSTPAKPVSETPQPGIFRGGLVQQLRSITSSVLGDGEAEEENLEEEGADGTTAGPIPSPPSLNDLVDAPAYTDDLEALESEAMDEDIPDAPEIEFPKVDTPRNSSGRQDRASAPPANSPAMPIPAVPGQSRWRNQKSQPIPLNAPPAAARTPSNSASGQRPAATASKAVPVPPPQNTAPTNNTAPVKTPAQTKNLAPTKSNLPPQNKVPAPPSTPPTDPPTVSPTVVAPHPSKTNSSRRVTTTKDRLNSQEITLPTAQVTELDENRIKLSDRAVAEAGNGAAGADAVPLVSKKLPPGRPKPSKEPSISLPAVISNDASGSDSPKPTAEASAVKESPEATAKNGTSVGSNRQMSLTAPDSTIPSASTAATTAAPQNKSFDMEIPSVLVRLAGPSDIPVGRKGEYELITQNTGIIPLNGAIVRMDIPKGVTTEIDESLKAQTETEVLEDGSLAIVWQVSELGPGKAAKLPLKLMAAEARNFAIAMEWTVMPQNGELLVQVQKPDLQIGLEGPAEVAYGVPQMYRLKISNPGTAPAENVMLNLAAEPYGANSSPLGTIAPGTNRVVEVELTFQQRGKLKIKAEVVGDNLKAASEIDVVVQQAVLEATLSGAESEYIGATANYQLELKNSGDTPSENVIAQIELPEGVKLAQLPDGARLSGRILLWDINALAAGEARTFSWQAELQTAGEKLFQATCRGSAGGSVVTQIQTRVEAVADLKLTLSDPPSPSPVGEEVVYELQITNRGQQSANKVKVLAQFSEGIEPSGAIGAEHKLVPGQVLFEPIPTIAAGDTLKLQVRALASEAGVHRFRIEVQTDDEEIHHVLEESTRYMQTAARPTGTKLR